MRRRKTAVFFLILGICLSVLAALEREGQPPELETYRTLARSRAFDLRCYQKIEADPNSVGAMPHLRRVEMLSAVLPKFRQMLDRSSLQKTAKLIRQYAVEGSDIYEAACAESLCIPLAKNPEEKEAHAVEALKLLVESTRFGCLPFRSYWSFQEEERLTTLSDRPDFRKLLKELEEELIVPKPEPAVMPRER